MPGGPPGTASNLETHLESIPQRRRMDCTGHGGGAMEIAAHAVMRGGHISIGLGAHHYDRIGKPSNADLITEVADMAGIFGRPIAGTEQARKLVPL